RHASAGVSGHSGMETVSLPPLLTENATFSAAPRSALIFLGTGALSLLTVLGNALVIISICVNRRLQTVNSYFIFSLACADLIIGAFSMNVYAVYVWRGAWPLGAALCDLWLSIDYVASNASVMNLLIISCDRFLCVSRPHTYPARRTARAAAIVIAAAWLLSLLLWAPAIVLWQFVEGVRTVPQDACYIQFFSNPAATLGTAIAAFYLPVAVMCILYLYILRASRCRVQPGERPQQRPQGPVRLMASAKVLFQWPGDGRSRSAGSAASERDAEGERAAPSARLELHAAGHDGAAQMDCRSRRGSSLPELSPGSGDEEVDGGSGPGAAPRVPPARCRRARRRRLSSENGEASGETASGGPRLRVGGGGGAGAARRSGSFGGARARRERKLTRTVAAVLLAFIVTWTPYNVMVLLAVFCTDCVPHAAWELGYWLCYVNSAVNPACYALCIREFKRTFLQLMRCRCGSRAQVR
uniref:Muscarinic acetylcholine receptor n=1 Tax=Petromyzon marinus TaxID=7757 RepID=S4S1F2_PETMA